MAVCSSGRELSDQLPCFQGLLAWLRTPIQVTNAGVDPEFLLRGGANPWGGGGKWPQPNILVIFSEKSSQIKEILVCGGGGSTRRVRTPPPNLPLSCDVSHAPASREWSDAHSHRFRRLMVRRGGEGGGNKHVHLVLSLHDRLLEPNQN